MILDRTILIKNYYYMLSYALLDLDKKTYKEVESEDFEEIYDLFADILSKGISKLLKQGLYRSYINVNEDLNCLRGKINMSFTIKNEIQSKKKLNCNYDELSEDNYLNQILKSTIIFLICNTKIKLKYKNDLKKKLQYFSCVSLIDFYYINFSLVNYNRNNLFYKTLINICYLIREGMLLTTNKGKYKVVDLFDEKVLPKLYEKFILEYYRKHYPSLNVNASLIDWALDNGNRNLLPEMRSDIYIKKDNDILIIDAKYYGKTTQESYGVNTIHSHNLYQIFTYVKNEEYNYKENKYKVAGMLLYAKTIEEIIPNNTYLLSGNEISIKTLDLSKPFNDIASQLDEIIHNHYGNVIKVN